MIKIRVKGGRVKGKIPSASAEIAIETAQAMRSIALELSAREHDMSIVEAIDEITRIAKIARLKSEESAP